MSYYSGGKCGGVAFEEEGSLLVKTLYIKRGVPASACSFCSSLFALRGKEEVLNLFSLFTAECDPGCFTLIS